MVVSGRCVGVDCICNGVCGQMLVLVMVVVGVIGTGSEDGIWR